MCTSISNSSLLVTRLVNSYSDLFDLQARPYEQKRSNQLLGIINNYTMNKKLAMMVMAITVAVLLGTSPSITHATAVTINEAKGEVEGFKTIVHDLTSSDLKKPVNIDKFKEKTEKRIDKILEKLEKGKLNGALNKMRGLMHLLDKKLADSTMNEIESAMPLTMSAMNYKH